MDCYVGIDLGSTTTKAIYLDLDEKILGRGITNSRSNYDIACQVARQEAEINSRFSVLRGRIERSETIAAQSVDLMAWLACSYRLAQHMRQLEDLEEQCFISVRSGAKGPIDRLDGLLRELFADMRAAIGDLFTPNLASRSDFFRDLATSQFLERAETLSGSDNALFDALIGTFDKSIMIVEGESYANAFGDYMGFACDRTLSRPEFAGFREEVFEAVQHAAQLKFNDLNVIGTGYGRQRLPFPKKQIRSEILCHGLGAHYMFPDTRTVLDIGGQDTKAIQVDASGIVTNFQMNDRCAAGCGRYLGYIADEMNMGVHELGPIALQAQKAVRINSTCTVFAGAELRERLALGERREDILAGLHRAIILRAMSLLARSGGIDDEFTFTGGVAKNPAAVLALRDLVSENYGERIINISPDSIYTGAIGAALFAKRDVHGEALEIDVTKLRTRVSKPAKKNRALPSLG